MYAVLCTRKMDGEVQLVLQGEPLDRIHEWIKFTSEHNEHWVYEAIKYEIVPAD